MVACVLSINSVAYNRVDFNQIGEWGTGPYNDFVVNGNYAYVAAGFGGIEILDISNPASISKVGSFCPGEEFLLVDMHGGNLLACSPIGKQIVMLNVTDPSNPIVLDSVDFVGNPMDFTVWNDTMYVAEGCDEGIRTGSVLSFELTPSGFIFQSRIPGDFATAIDVNDKWIAVGGMNGLTLYDRTSGIVSSSLSKVNKTVNAKLSEPSFHQVILMQDAVCQYQRGYVAICPIVDGVLGDFVSLSYGGTVMDDPSDPLFSGYRRRAALVGNYLYFADSTGLAVADLSDRVAPQIVKQWEFDANASSVVLSGDTVWVTRFLEGIECWNIGDMQNPVLMGQYDHSQSITDIAFENGRLGFSDEWGRPWQGLGVLDVSDPVNISLLGRYEYAYFGLGQIGSPIAMDGDYLYQRKGSYLKAYDISDPSNISEVGNIQDSCSSSFVDLQVDNGKAYRAELFSWLSMADVSDPANPYWYKSCWEPSDRAAM